MKFKRVNLPFGARLMYVKNKINKSTNVEITFDGGASKEKIPGLAHFVEHMFFSGTDKLSAQEVKKEYFKFSETNAYTNFKDICFSGRIFTNELSDYFSTVAMLITETNFSKKAIEDEKKVVIQEINESKDNNKLKFYNYNFTKIYNHDFINHDVIGNEKSVMSITRKDVLEFVNQYFVANNIDVYICTPLSLNKVKKILIKNLVKKLRVNNDFVRPKLFYFDISNFNFLQSKYKNIGKSYLSFSFKTNHGIKDINFYNREVLISYMINDFASGIEKKLRHEKKFVYSAEYFISFGEMESVANIITETDKNNVNVIIETVAEYINELKEKGFTLEQLNQAKRRLRFSHESKNITTKFLINKLYQFRRFGKVLDDEFLYKTAMNTTLDECNQMIKEIFDIKNIGCSIYGDINKTDLMKEKKFLELYKN